MRRSLMTWLMAWLVTGLLAPAATARNHKHLFDDVTLPDGRQGEIEATVKVQKKTDSVTCNYFVDPNRTVVGYYFKQVEPAPTDPDDVLDFCLEWYEERQEVQHRRVRRPGRSRDRELRLISPR